jgi:uncharacterized glyoxalase superfamily protein PhnB
VEKGLLEAVQDPLSAVDLRMSPLARLRERVRTVEEALLRHEHSTDEELLAVLAGMGDEPGLTRRLTLLVYRDLEAMADFVAHVFGFGPGPLHRDEADRVMHAELYVGDGLLWLHREAPEFGLASPGTLDGSTVCMAVSVVDVEAHHERVRAAGAQIAKPPQDMPYGVREYDARDPEGGLWSFMQELEEDDDE